MPTSYEDTEKIQRQLVALCREIEIIDLVVGSPVTIEITIELLKTMRSTMYRANHHMTELQSEIFELQNAK